MRPEGDGFLLVPISASACHDLEIAVPLLPVQPGQGAEEGAKVLLGRAEVVRELGAVDQGHGDAGSTPRRDKEPLQKKTTLVAHTGKQTHFLFLR